MNVQLSILIKSSPSNHLLLIRNSPEKLEIPVLSFNRFSGEGLYRRAAERVLMGLLKATDVAKQSSSLPNLMLLRQQFFWSGVYHFSDD